MKREARIERSLQAIRKNQERRIAAIERKIKRIEIDAMIEQSALIWQ